MFLFSTLTIWQWFPLLSVLPPVRSDFLRLPSQQGSGYHSDSANELLLGGQKEGERFILQQWGRLTGASEDGIFQCLARLCIPLPVTGCGLGAALISAGLPKLSDFLLATTASETPGPRCAYDLTTYWQLPNLLTVLPDLPTVL